VALTAKMTAVARGFVIDNWDNVDVFMVILVSFLASFYFIDLIHKYIMLNEN